MNSMIQMDLLSFAAQQATETIKEQPKVVAPEAIEVVREQLEVVAVVEQPKVVAPARNFTRDGRTAMPSGKAERIATNLAAIRLLKRGREFSWEEQLKTGQRFSYEGLITLSRFNGWGGLTEVFLAENRHYQVLKNLLTEEEYRTAQSSILDSYYTPETLIDFMWNIVRAELKVKMGKVAELGTGTGNFIGHAPMSGAYRFTAVEVDEISGDILQALYPEADVRVASLEKVKLAVDYDLVIGNVPFGQVGPYDRKYLNWNLHNYFIARALDCLKPNGYAVLITSSSTMDAPGSIARLTNEASLQKAFRLPKNTFAGTEIVADILVFRKSRENTLDGNLKWVPTGDNTGKMEINEYYVAHPEHVFGTLSNTGKMYGKLNAPTVLPDGKSLEDRFLELSLPEPVEVKPTFELMPEVQVTMYENCSNIAETETVPEYCREYSIFSTLDAVYQVIDGAGQRMKDRKDNNFTLNAENSVVRQAQGVLE